MNQTNSGDTELKVDDRLRALEKTLDEYTKFLGIDAVMNNGLDISNILNAPQEEITKWSPEDCKRAAYYLLRQATFIQYKINRLNAIITWADANITYIIAPKLLQYSQFLAAEAKRALAISDSSFTVRLQELIVNSTTRLNTISFIPQHLKIQADILLDLSQTKRGTL